jgi:hypothetical protein
VQAAAWHYIGHFFQIYGETQETKASTEARFGKFGDCLGIGGKKKSVNVLLRACLVETIAEKGASYLAVGQ